MTLTKADISEMICDRLNITQKESQKITDTLIGYMKDALCSGEDILISGFGKFFVRSKKERKGRNPATSEEMTLCARKVVRFKGSAKLREKINP